MSKVLYRVGTNPARFYINFDGLKPQDGTRGRAAILSEEDAQQIKKHLKMLGFGNYRVASPEEFPERRGRR